MPGDRQAPTVQLRRLAAELRSLRTSSGLTRDGIVERTGINVATLYRIEHARARPQTRTLRTLLDLYGVEKAHQVIPFGAGAHAGLPGSFGFMQFTEAAIAAVAYIGSMAGEPSWRRRATSAPTDLCSSAYAPRPRPEVLTVGGWFLNMV
jgi:transcriptional regulator with XRE-family HTH domain